MKLYIFLANEEEIQYIIAKKNTKNRADVCIVSHIILREVRNLL